MIFKHILPQYDKKKNIPELTRILDSLHVWYPFIISDDFLLIIPFFIRSLDLFVSEIIGTLLTSNHHKEE